MRIREATVEDVEALFDIRCSVEQNAMSRKELARFGITPASVKEMIVGGDTVTSLVEEDGLAVAFALGQVSCGSVFAVFVRPGHEDRGYGKAVLQRVEAELQHRGVRYGSLSTGPEAGWRAHGFYRHLGWIHMGFMKDGQARYEKELAETEESEFDSPSFIPGRELSAAFFKEAVRPILQRRFASGAYAAALIGYGSDVLGFDTAMSTDHWWGPRLVVLFADGEKEERLAAVSEALAQELPVAFRGWSTNQEDGQLVQKTGGPVHHMVQVKTLSDFFIDYVGYAGDRIPSPQEWLTLSEHRLLAVTAGPVFHDDIGLRTVRERLSFYTRDVWLYVLAAEWRKIEQEEAFLGRCGQVGDELGSRLVAARLVHSLMRLAFLMERKYPPYSKWFGRAFRDLTIYPELGSLLEATLRAETWRERERRICDAYRVVMAMHNSVGLTPPLATEPEARYAPSRPYLTPMADRFAKALRKEIIDEEVLRLRPDIGSINQFVSSTDVSDNNDIGRFLRAIYGGG